MSSGTLLKPSHPPQSPTDLKINQSNFNLCSIQHNRDKHSGAAAATVLRRKIPNRLNLYHGPRASAAALPLGGPHTLIHVSILNDLLHAAASFNQSTAIRWYKRGKTLLQDQTMSSILDKMLQQANHQPYDL